MDPVGPRWGGRRAITVEPSLPSLIWLRPRAESLRFPFDDDHALVVKDSCSAWAAAVTMLALNPGDEALVTPAADAGLIAALAEVGVDCRWYALPPKGDPDACSLHKYLSTKTRAVVLSHSLGLPHDGAVWRQWCQDHGLFLLEDAAHALHATAPSGWVGRYGDAAVFRLTVALGTRDGAVLVMPAGGPEAMQPTGPRHGSPETKLMGRTSSMGTITGVRLASMRTMRLLPILADSANAERRRANFQALMVRLGDLLPDGWSEVPAGSSPLVFPIGSADPGGLRERLARHRVQSWPLFAWRSGAKVPQMLGVERCIGVPDHQELGPRDLDVIVDVVTATTRPHRERRRRQRLEWVGDISALRPDWEELALRAGNPFASWPWVTVWWSLFGSGRSLAVLTYRRTDGSLLAVLPLYEAKRRPIRLARFVGHGFGDELGPVCDPDDRAEVGWLLRRAVIEHELPWDLLLAERMPIEEGWGSALGGTLMRHEWSPTIRLGGLDWRQFLGTRSRNFREQVGRRERRLQREHDVHYRLADDPDRLNADLDVLFALHRARWGAGSMLTERGERFHRAWAAEARRAGWLRLWFLELDGRAVAAWYGLRFAQREFYYQAGRDPAFESKSVGFVLLAHTIRAAADDGMHEYRLLRGGEAYKSRFASHDRWLETRAVPCSWAGSAAATSAAALAASPGRALLKEITERR
jgi:CelD/BcsL family acetyltransferase involved in cellulose biosynthesis